MILVFVETAADSATEVSLETVTFARSLAERPESTLAGPVHALVVGALPEKVADELGAYGVAEVHHAVGDAFSATVITSSNALAFKTAFTTAS